MYNYKNVKKMETNYQEIANLVAKKCQEVLAPLYAELEELRAKYYPHEPKIEPTKTQEEIEDAEFKKNIQEMKQMLIKSGRIKA